MTRTRTAVHGRAEKRWIPVEGDCWTAPWARVSWRYSLLTLVADS